jgi:uncharacterized membrane protein
MFEIFKNIYNSFYEIPTHYMNFENGLYSHVFTILSIILILFLVCFMIKQIVNVFKLKKINKSTKIKIEKLLIDNLKEIKK